MKKRWYVLGSVLIVGMVIFLIFGWGMLALYGCGCLTYGMSFYAFRIRGEMDLVAHGRLVQSVFLVTMLIFMAGFIKIGLLINAVLGVIGSLRILLEKEQKE